MPESSPIERVRRVCLALPGTWEKVSHGEPTFWIGKKMFATFANAANHHGGGRHAVWCKATHVTQDLLGNKTLRATFARRTSGRLAGSASISTAGPTGAAWPSGWPTPTRWQPRRCQRPVERQHRPEGSPQAAVADDCRMLFRRCCAANPSSPPALALGPRDGSRSRRHEGPSSRLPESTRARQRLVRGCRLRHRACAAGSSWRDRPTSSVGGRRTWRTRGAQRWSPRS